MSDTATDLRPVREAILPGATRCAQRWPDDTWTLYACERGQGGQGVRLGRCLAGGVWRDGRPVVAIGEVDARTLAALGRGLA